MSANFKILLEQLQAVLFVYQPQIYTEKLAYIKLLSKSSLIAKYIMAYHECLLFISAYPEQPAILTLAQKELNRISRYLKQLPEPKLKQFTDSGLPYTKMTTRFSCDILFEMLDRYECQIEIDSFEEEGVDLNTLLNLTLPKVLKLETTAGLDNLSLLQLLGVKPKQSLLFLLNEFNKLDNQPLIKDYLWEALKIYLNISSSSKNYARAYNKLNLSEPVFENSMLKKFDATALLGKPLPNKTALSEAASKQVIDTIRKSLLLTMRETDTSTYMDEQSLMLFQLERGVTIALYGLKPNRQLPYQSYIGYTAFKNGFPVAYGGSWVFGYSAMFGLNILETYRGGESGFIMCQLLRTYIQCFNLSYVEVENYQFGKDNPDGIKSGAFWFYYRYGFRPVDNALNMLASKEYDKINEGKNYRSSEKTLLALSESNIALNLKQSIPLKKEHVFSKVLNMIANEFKGNNTLAAETAIKEFCSLVLIEEKLNEDQKQTLEEVALWARAFKIKDDTRLKLLKKMIEAKAIDVFAYNQLIQDLESVKRNF